MKGQNEQSYDQKKGSADQQVSGEKRGMPGAAIGRAERPDDGGPEGNSPDRKTARNGSDSNAR
jgi:hypothetical protein